MHQNEKDRCAEINRRQELDQRAFESAWHEFQNTKIDLLADSDDETCRRLWNAIRTYVIMRAH